MNELQIKTDDKLLQVFENIKNSIAEIDDIKELHNLRDLANGYETAWRAHYARSGFGKEHMRLGWETKFRCEYKMGKMLREMELKKRRMTNLIPLQKLHDETSDSLDDLGITKTQSFRYQTLSYMRPPRRYEILQDKYSIFRACCNNLRS